MRFNIIDSVKCALPETWQTAEAISLWKWIGIVVALITLFLFGDTLLPVIGHALHVLNEIIESVLVHFLEWTFQTSKRQAELIVFWASLVTALYLFWLLSRKAYHRTKQLYATIQTNWRLKKDSGKITLWSLIKIIVIALSMTLFLFS